MIGHQDSAGENTLVNRLGPGAGSLFDTFLVSHFFDIFIRRKQAVVTNCRFIRFGTADIKSVRRFGPGLAAPVHKRLIQAAAAHQQN